MSTWFEPPLMTFTDEEKRIVIDGKAFNLKWNIISKLVNKCIETCRTFWKRYKLYPKNRRITFWTRYDDPYDQNAITRNEMMGGITVMFWGCFSYNAWGPLVVVKEKEDSAKYVDMMEEHLLPELDHSLVPLMFMQDGARCHTCPNSMQFFPSNGVVLFGPWPPQSPDLNTIEWVWGNLKQKLQYYRPSGS